MQFIIMVLELQNILFININYQMLPAYKMLSLEIKMTCFIIMQKWKITLLLIFDLL